MKNQNLKIGDVVIGRGYSDDIKLNQLYYIVGVDIDNNFYEYTDYIYLIDIDGRNFSFWIYDVFKLYFLTKSEERKHKLNILNEKTKS